MHNKELENQRQTILQALRFSRDDLFIQEEDHRKYASPEDFTKIEEEINKHLDLLDEAENLVVDWSIKLDQSISTKCL